MACCNETQVFTWNNLNENQEPSTTSSDSFKFLRVKISSEGVFYTCSSEQQVAVVSDEEVKVIVEADPNVDCQALVEQGPNVCLVSEHKQKKCLTVTVVGAEGIVGKAVDVEALRVCYDACSSPDGHFVVICGREDGVAIIRDGKVESILQTEFEKKTECPTFLSSSKYFVYSSFNPQNNIKKSLHFTKWRTDK